jgi:hypothetical protein
VSCVPLIAALTLNLPTYEASACPLCAAVEAGQEKEKEQQQKQLVDTVNKVNAVPVTAFVLPKPSATVLFYFETVGSCDPVSIRPPSPPPWQA